METGAPGASRTRDHLLRRQMLYPSELRAQAFILQCFYALQKLRIDFWILLLYTYPMNEKKAIPASAESVKDWQKTQYANLVRYVPSGTYYARLRVKGKLIRRSLKTDVLSVAKLRLADFEKQERQRAESCDSVAAGKMTVNDAIEIHRRRVAGDASLKPRTREYHDQRIAALLR